MMLSEQLADIFHDLGHLMAEISLVGSGLLILIVGLFRVSTTIIKSVVAVLLLSCLLHISRTEEWLFQGMIFQSELSQQFTRIACLTGLLILLFPTSKHHRSSYYFIILMIVLGSVMMMQSMHLLLIYLCVEMVSHGSYILTNFSFNKKSHEAGLKYLLFGGVVSAIMLFGMSMLYGVSGSLLINEMNELSLYGQVGAVMLMAGVLFKISAVPFHIWTPNVYQAAPVDTVTFFSVVPKLAGLVLLKNMLEGFSWGNDVILFLGILTIAFGTFGALKQTNVRRLVSYGAIAHTGFLIPFAVLDIPNELFVWYALIYALMNVGIFYAIGLFEKRGIYELSDYSGIGKKVPILGILMTVILVTLIGLPPTAGFTAKWFLFSSLWGFYAEYSDQILLTYLLVAVFATAIALFYYLRIPYFAFLKNGDMVIEKPPTLAYLIVGSIVFILLGLFFFPEWLQFLT